MSTSERAAASDSDAGRATLLESYRRWRESRLGNITERIEQQLVFELCGDIEGLDLLDVGCGDGSYVVVASERSARAAGVDTSPLMIYEARLTAERRKADVTFLIGNAEHLPFADETFDRVISITMLCFCANADAAVREMTRVLRPGGLLVMGELGRWSLWAAWRRLRGYLGSRRWRDAIFRSANELESLADRAGLTVKETRGAVYYPPLRCIAHLMQPLDSRLGRLTTMGAALVAVAARKGRGNANLP